MSHSAGNHIFCVDEDIAAVVMPAPDATYDIIREQSLSDTVYPLSGDTHMIEIALSPVELITKMKRLFATTRAFALRKSRSRYTVGRNSDKSIVVPCTNAAEDVLEIWLSDKDPAVTIHGLGGENTFVNAEPLQRSSHQIFAEVQLFMAGICFRLVPIRTSSACRILKSRADGQSKSNNTEGAMTTLTPVSPSPKTVNTRAHNVYKSCSLADHEHEAQDITKSISM